ncbi:Clavaminate synthase-like protein [Gonapodya prolifera JEL478]|uniref:Clavaminate synthase-like protein n=1 Tax=Gonapodya prolifera (strain JEL478) TaxID=1344416 RepID=A0A139ADU1_GONPJ|nr:Clavaminate synthase-like protein [Gonapodya prolifera JEL478]|eukprot:KXS14937.1 Clavaminate synthase-like protein [Gonapodya prolifera JEL478]
MSAPSNANPPPDALPFPLISLSDLSSPDAESRSRLAHAVTSALHDVGFLYLVDHGIEQRKIGRMFEIAKKSFDFPDAEKERFRQDHNQLGFKPFADQPNHAALAGTEGDATKMYGKEHWNLPGKWGVGNFDDNMEREWPPVILDHQDELDDFDRDCNTLVKKLLRCVAEGLQIPESTGGVGYFDELHRYDRHSGCVLRFLHYPPLPPDYGLAETGYTRINAHFDIGTVTLLFQQDVGGLHAKDQSGKWVYVPPMEGAIVVNLGEELMYMTDGYLKATQHKVVATTPTEHSTSRFSIAYFAYPDFETPIRPIASPVVEAHGREERARGVPNGGPPDGTSAMQYLEKKYKGIYGFTTGWSDKRGTAGVKTA